jgi:hypothetical protein
VEPELATWRPALARNAAAIFAVHVFWLERKPEQCSIAFAETATKPFSQNCGAIYYLLDKLPGLQHYRANHRETYPAENLLDPVMT